MSERVEHIEKVERVGSKFRATLHTVEELGPLEVIQVCKGLRNEIINRKDEIKNLENQKTAIDKQIAGQQISIDALAQRVKDIFTPRLVEAKRLLSPEKVKTYWPAADLDQKKDFNFDK